jgi:hypothetical protein
MEIKERPIEFTGEMIRALLDNRKSQTRRVMRVQPHDDSCKISTLMESTGSSREIGKHRWLKMLSNDEVDLDDHAGKYFACPYGYAGDRLWVKEPWFNNKEYTENMHALLKRWPYGDVQLPVKSEYPDIMYKADYPEGMLCKWKTARYMPRFLSRILLEITDIRVQRLQAISEDDAIAEGAKKFPSGYVFENTGYDKAKLCHTSPATAFNIMWDEMIYKNNDQKCWEANPWVWAISFKRLECAGVAKAA